MRRCKRNFSGLRRKGEFSNVSRRSEPIAEIAGPPSQASTASTRKEDRDAAQEQLYKSEDASTLIEAIELLAPFGFGACISC